MYYLAQLWGKNYVIIIMKALNMDLIKIGV